MKKIFISILSAAMFAACAKTETEDVIPVNPEPEGETQTVYVEIGATTGSDTKATYDENLAAYWEAGDQILVVQGSATSKTYNFPSLGSKDFEAGTNVLSLNDGEMTNKAKFIGDITIYDSDNNRYFHFAYPAEQSQMKTNTHIPYGQSSVSTEYKTTTTCSYTIPSEQDGKWTPFLCTSTTDKTTAANITNINFGKSRNACFAVRVFETDGKTPKKIKSIIITADKNIVGTISATTENDGSFNDDKVVFGISGGGNTITADNLQNIEPLNGLYEYRFEVLPSDAGFITLRITDENGSVVERKTSTEKTFTANKRSGVNVYWDAAGISMDATTWFEDSCAKNELSALSSANTIYCNVTLFGIGADDIKEKGVLVNGTEDYKNNDSSHKFSSEIAATNGNGAYTVQAYAVLNDGTELKTDEKIVYIVDEKVLPAITSHTIRSSYNNNGAVEKTNDINGNLIKANVSLNDCWASNNLVKSVTLVYDGLTEAMTVGTEFEKSVDLRTYKNTHIEVEFSNGYVISTPYYTINVTGIPYYWINSETSVKGGGSGTTVSGTTTLFAPTGTLTANVVYKVVIGGGTVATTGTLTVGNQQIFSTKSPSGIGNTKTTTIEGSQDITIATGSIDYSYKNSYGLGNTKSTVYKIGIEY